MLYVGIDPGKSGAMAIVSDSMWLMGVWDFEFCISILKEHKESIAFVYLEEVHSMPKQGVASTFSFGENYGWWKGVLQALEIPFKTVRPQDWQKGLVPKKSSLSDKPSLEVARGMFPKAPLTRKKDHNRADAILLAYVCSKREVVHAN